MKVVFQRRYGTYLYEVLQERALAAGPYLFEATLEEKRKDGDAQETLRFTVDAGTPR